LSKISEPQPLPELNVAEMPAIGPDNTWVTE